MSKLVKTLWGGGRQVKKFGFRTVLFATVYIISSTVRTSAFFQLSYNSGRLLLGSTLTLIPPASIFGSHPFFYTIFNIIDISTVLVYYK